VDLDDDDHDINSESNNPNNNLPTIHLPTHSSGYRVLSNTPPSDSLPSEITIPSLSSSPLTQTAISISSPTPISHLFNSSQSDSSPIIISNDKTFLKISEQYPISRLDFSMEDTSNETQSLMIDHRSSSISSTISTTTRPATPVLDNNSFLQSILIPSSISNKNKKFLSTLSSSGSSSLSSISLSPILSSSSSSPLSSSSLSNSSTSSSPSYHPQISICSPYLKTKGGGSGTDIRAVNLEKVLPSSQRDDLHLPRNTPPNRDQKTTTTTTTTTILDTENASKPTEISTTLPDTTITSSSTKTVSSSSNELKVDQNNNQDMIDMVISPNPVCPVPNNTRERGLLERGSDILTTVSSSLTTKKMKLQ